MKHLSSLLRCFCLLALAFVTAARAEDARAANRVVLLAPPGSASGEQATFEATRALLAELSVALVIQTLPDDFELGSVTQRARVSARANAALAVVWFVRKERAMLVYFYEPAQDRLLTRRVEVSESMAAASEEVALIVRSAVAAALEGSEVMMTEVAVPEPSRAQPPPAPVQVQSAPRAVAREHARLSAGYVATSISGDASVQHGAAFALTALPDGRTRLGLAFVLTPAFEVASEAVSVRIRRYPVLLSIGIALGAGRLRLVPELGFMAEFVRRDTLRTAPTFEAEGASSRWLWGVCPRLRGEYRFAPRVHGYASLGADFVLNPHAEVFEEVSTSETLLAWAALRPNGEAGISVQIW